MNATEAVKTLQDFRDLLVSFQALPNQQPRLTLTNKQVLDQIHGAAQSDLTERINRKVHQVSQIVDDCRISRVLRITPPAYVGGPIQNMDAIANWSETPYRSPMAQQTQAIVDQAMGVIQCGDYDRFRSDHGANQSIWARGDQFLIRATSAWFLITAPFRTLRVLSEIHHAVMWAIGILVFSLLAAFIAYRQFEGNANQWGYTIAAGAGIATLCNAVVSQFRNKS